MTRSSSAPQERLEAIETLLLWEGRVSRSRLLEFFDIHSTLASRDLAAFRAMHPDACAPDVSTKSYVALPTMRPTLTKGHFIEYQRLIGAAGAMEHAVPGVAIETAHHDVTHIQHHHFAQIHQALRSGDSVAVRYRSMGTPTPHMRIIRPHALIQAGPRWHIRAYCSKVSAFRDFNLGRISSVKAATSTELPGPDADVDWQTMVRVRLVPHRDLDGDQSQMVRDEYMRGTVAVVFSVRAPMAKYLIQSFRAAIDPLREKAPEYLLMVQAPKSLPECALWR